MTIERLRVQREMGGQRPVLVDYSCDIVRSIDADSEIDRAAAFRQRDRGARRDPPSEMIGRSAVANRAGLVLVVDDDVSVRESLGALLQAVGFDVEVFASPEEFFARPVRNVPSCLILDVQLPGLDGLEVQKRLAATDGALQIVFITGHGDIPMAVEAMQNGAFDFLQKPFRDQDLIDRVQRALERDGSTRTQLKATDKIREHLETLTPREREVLDLVTAGKPNKVMAADLGVSQRTIEIHRARVMEKMQARSLAQLVRMVLDLRQPVSESHSSGQSSG